MKANHPKRMASASTKHQPPNGTIQFVIILAVIGSLVSMYLVKDHFSTEKSACDLGSNISCSKINRSVYAKLFGVPVAVYGVTWFLCLLAFSYKIWENGVESATWITTHFLWSVAGALFCFYLIYGEVMVGALCPYCTIVHIICFIVLPISYRLYKDLKLKPGFADLFYFFTNKQYVWTVAIALLHVLPLLYFNLLPVEHKTPLPSPNYPISNLDNFSKCITQHGITMYGSNECPFCSRQKELFGSAFQYINYINCNEHEDKCFAQNIMKLPTWLQHAKDGTVLQRHIGLLTLKELKSWTDSKCSFD